MENMPENPRKQYILQSLMESPNGMQRSVLLEKFLEDKIGAKKTFIKLVKELDEEGYVIPIKDHTKGKNARVFLKPKIDEKQEQDLKKILKIYENAEMIFTSKLPKKTKIALSSHILKIISSTYSILTKEYVFNENGNIMYEIGLKFIKNHLFEFKKLLEKYFKPKEILQIKMEFLYVTVMNEDSDSSRLSHIMFTTKNLRSREEINLDYLAPNWNSISLPKSQSDPAVNAIKQIQKDLEDSMLKGSIPNSVLDVPTTSVNHVKYNKKLDDINSTKKKLLDQINALKYSVHFKDMKDYKIHQEKVSQFKNELNDVDISTLETPFIELKEQLIEIQRKYDKKKELESKK